MDTALSTTSWDTSYMDTAAKPAGVPLRDWYPAIIALFHVLVTCGIPGNLLVLLSFMRFPELRSPTTLVILNQSIADLLTCIIITPYTWFNYTHSGAAFIGQQKYLCLMYLLAATIVVVSSAFNIFLLSMERFIAILLPFHYYRWVTMKSIKVSLTILWSVVVAITFPPLVGWNNFKPNYGCSPSRVFAKDFGTSFFLVPNMTLSIMTAIVNVIVCFTAFKIRNKISDENILNGDRRAQPTKADFKILKMFLLIVGAFYATWLPYTTFYLLFYANPRWLSKLGQPTWIFVLYEIAKVLVFANPVINSLIYAFKNKPLRESMLKILKNE